MRKLLVLLPLLLASPVGAQSVDEVNARIDMVLGDHAAYEAAIGAIQDAVAGADAASVAAWVSYPLTVSPGKDALVIENEEQFVAKYDAIMTEEVVAAVTEQSYEDLFVNSDGIMFGTGEVWLNGICKDNACAEFDVRIITIQATAE